MTEEKDRIAGPIESEELNALVSLFEWFPDRLGMNRGGSWTYRWTPTGVKPSNDGFYLENIRTGQ